MMNGESGYERDVEQLEKIDTDLAELLDGADLMNMVIGIGYAQMASLERHNVDAAERMGQTTERLIRSDPESYREVILTVGEAQSLINFPDDLLELMEVKITDDGEVVDTRETTSIDID